MHGYPLRVLVPVAASYGRGRGSVPPPFHSLARWHPALWALRYYPAAGVRQSVKKRKNSIQ